MKLLAENFALEHYQETRTLVHNIFRKFLEKTGLERALFGPQTFTEDIMSLVWGEGLSETEHASQISYTFEAERPWIVLEDGRVVFITSHEEGNWIIFSAWEATEKYQFEGWEIPLVILGDGLEFMVEFPSREAQIFQRDMTSEELTAELKKEWAVESAKKAKSLIDAFRFADWKKDALAVNNRLPKDVTFVAGVRFEKLRADGSVELFE